MFLFSGITFKVTPVLSGNTAFALKSKAFEDLSKTCNPLSVYKIKLKTFTTWLYNNIINYSMIVNSIPGLGTGIKRVND